MTTLRTGLRSRRLGTGFLAMAALSLGGCLPSLTPDPPESLLTLQSLNVAPAGTSLQTGTAGGAPTLAVYTPSTPAKLDVLRVPVSVNETEIAYLQDTVWVEKPSRLFRRLLAETLRAKGTAFIVDGDSNPVLPDRRLTGSLLDLGYDAPTSTVVARFDAVRSTAVGEVVETRRFEAVETGIAPEAELIGPALNRVANTVANDVADWMAGAPAVPPIMREPAQ